MFVRIRFVRRRRHRVAEPVGRHAQGYTFADLESQRYLPSASTALTDAEAAGQSLKSTCRWKFLFPVRWPSSRGRPYVCCCKRKVPAGYIYRAHQHVQMNTRLTRTVRVSVGRTGRQRAVRV
jgi:hypothetical protein